jgi:hypothetical protein
MTIQGCTFTSSHTPRRTFLDTLKKKHILFISLTFARIMAAALGSF